MSSGLFISKYVMFGEGHEQTQVHMLEQGLLTAFMDLLRPHRGKQTPAGSTPQGVNKQQPSNATFEVGVQQTKPTPCNIPITQATPHRDTPGPTGRVKSTTYFLSLV